VVKRATQINVEYRTRRASRAASVLVLLLAVAGCSNSDYGGQTAEAPAGGPIQADSASPSVAPVIVGGGTIVVPAPHTGADGYPNINVDTARPAGMPVRSAEERDRLEAELLALGARQRSSADVTRPQSVIRELQDLGRTSKAEAERQIVSGAPPAKP
jgi:hypothetical protein